VADSAAPLAIHDTERILRVRQALEAAGFTPTEITRRLKPGDADTPRRDVPRLLKELQADAFGSLSRLFLLGLSARAEELHELLGPSLTEDLRALGLLVEHGSDARISTFRFAPFENILLLQECPWSPTIPGIETQVMSISGSTRTLAQMAISTPCESALELGTGNGIVGILQAASARRVIATDCNRRALNMTEFTARINGLGNVETRLGNMLEPVTGELFDRIITNPPYVLTPPKPVTEVRVMYRDSGLPADGLSESVVRGLPRFLKPGGFAQSMINWAHVQGQPWQERLQGWLKENDCDAWLLRFETLTPAQYATQWVPKMPDGEFPGYLETFDNWLRYYDREKIEAITGGLITLRRRESGTNWFAEDSVPKQLGPCGEAILRGFTARDYLTSLRSEADLLNTTFQLAPEARWVITSQPNEQGWLQSGSRLSLTQGLGFTLDVDATGMKLVTRIRGSRPLGAFLTEMATELHQEFSHLVSISSPLIQTLVEQGFLLPERRP